MSEAFASVVTDAMVCIEARKDEELGASKLITVTSLASGSGGVVGGLLGGVLT